MSKEEQEILEDLARRHALLASALRRITARCRSGGSSEDRLSQVNRMAEIALAKAWVTR